MKISVGGGTPSGAKNQSPAMQGVIGVSWRDHRIWRLAGLETLLSQRVAMAWPFRNEGLQTLAGWGRRPSGLRAERFSARRRIACLRLEDGFIRSLRPGRSEAPLSIVADDLGIYYDATAPSRLETLIASAHDERQSLRAEQIAHAWRNGRLSKYNHAPEVAPPMRGQFVLAVDQTAGDASIRYGIADARSFHRMLDAALDEHPSVPVVLKTHPDVISGRKRGHFNGVTPGQASRVVLLGSDAHPPCLLENAAAVYTVTSQMGFEALIWGKPVRTFGMPFYAGWGLTTDDLPAPDRRHTPHRVTLEDLVHAALVEYPRYLDPETGQRCEPERLMEWMALQRRMRERFPAQVHAVGFSRWKKPIVRAFLSGSDVQFTRRADSIPADGTLVSWGIKSETAIQARRASNGAAPSIRLEDGFLRSVGLGADLVRPISWVADDQGIYYDATRPSRLETMLRETDFDAQILERARALRERIVGEGFTKYNVGSAHWQRPPAARQLVLVPGQVEDDASIRRGAPGLRTNMALLRAVREARPAAWLVYKPHPDVVAGLRSSGEDESLARRWCDEIVTDAPMHALLDAADEIHVLTSLAGFEALLRGKPVVTYGCPFYSGWGLTTDVAAAPQVWARRGRKLSIDELVAATLILYPTYVSRRTGAFTTPEHALDELAEWRRLGVKSMPAWRRGMRPLLGLIGRIRSYTPERPCGTIRQNLRAHFARLSK